MNGLLRFFLVVEAVAILGCSARWRIMERGL